MIYIVIPVFNRWHFTQPCLESLQKQTYTSFKVIVVDHGSTDGTSKNIAREFPEVVVLKGDEDMWWTAATNLGVKYALESGATYVLTLNNDTIATPEYMAQLSKSIYDLPEDSLVGSCAIDITTGQILFAGEIEKWITESSISIKDNPVLMGSGYASVTRFPGRGLLIPAKVFQKIGLFDESGMPHYGADYDFTARAFKKGFSLYCAVNARIGIFPDASGANQNMKHKSLKSYYEHLFGMRGAANLNIFYKYAFRHCPWYALPGFLALGTLRRIGGYWLK